MKFILTLLLLSLPLAAFAQQPSDPALAACRELLGESTGRTIDLAARLSKAQADLKVAQDEVTNLKALNSADGKPTPPVPPKK